jgi:hypothetical protein
VEESGEVVGWWHTVAGEVHGLQRSTEPAAADPGGKGARRGSGCDAVAGGVAATRSASPARGGGSGSPACGGGL